MPAQIFGAEAAVINLNRAFNDQSTSNAVFQNQVAAAGTTTDSQMAFAKTFGAGFAGMTADALSTKLLGNLGVLPNAALQTALKDYITAAGIENIGIIGLQLGQILSGLENATGDQAAFKAAAVAWNNEVTASYNYSANPANTSAGPIGTDDQATTGVTIVLTNTADFVAPNATEAKFKTTANNDTIQATSADDLLVTADTIDGGAGKDTLNALLKDGVATAPTISNVEVINLSFADTKVANAFNAAGVTGAQQIWAAGNATTAVGETVTLTNVDKSTAVGLKSSDKTGALTVDLGFKAAQITGTSDVGSIVLGGTFAGSKVEVKGIETVAVSSTVSTNSVALNGDSIETVTASGDKAVTLDLKTGVDIVKTLKTVDASAATGAVTVDLAAALTNAVTVKTGSGADTIDLTGAAVKATIDTGAGNDTVMIDANKAHAITLGAGNDTVVVSATGVLTLTTATTVGNSASSVTDFVVGTDKIKVGGVIKTLSGTQFSAVQGSSDLLAAVTSAHDLAATAIGDSVVFQFGADTYVYKNNGLATLSADDSLVKLTGVVAGVGDSILVV